MELEITVKGHACHDMSIVVSVVNKRDRRRVLSTARSTYRGEILQVQSLGQSSGGK